MAKYDVTYSCGHTAEISLFGPHKDRTRKIEWMQREALCPDCYQAARERERTEATAKAAEIAKADCLPELTGTPKQVAWAETIRARMTSELDKWYGQGQQAANDGKLAEAAQWQIAVAAQWYDDVRAQTAATWWIDHRDDRVVAMWQQYLKVNYSDRLPRKNG